MIMQQRDHILVEREKTHGDFRLNAGISQQLKRIIHTQFDYDKLDGRQKEALDLICTKIGRIMSGGHAHKDSWIDIAGYAKLGSEACDG